MNEWKEIKFGTLLDYIGNGTSDYQVSKITNYPVTRIETISEGKVDFQKVGYLTTCSEKYLLKKGDILFSNINSLKHIGKVAYFNSNEKLYHGMNLLLFRVNEQSDSLFIFYALVFYKNWFERMAAQAINQASINQTTISDFIIQIPSTKQLQRKIARILSTADAVIEKTHAAIAKYKAIKQGMLNDLFTRGIDTKTGKLRPKYQDASELYKKSKLGWIPKEWDVSRLEEVTDYVDYRGKTPPKSEFGVYLVTARNIKDGYIDYEVSKEYIREDSFESAMSRGKAKLGDVLITTEAPLGNVAQIDKEDIALAQRVIKYRGFENKLNNDFLGRFLMSDIFQRQLYANATGSTVLGIKGSRLHRLYICVPKPKEQESIVKRLISTEDKIQTEQSYLHKLRQIKAGLMADLLSGKKEVVDDEEVKTQEMK
jgi:type I restriction enzyme S subunit